VEQAVGHDLKVKVRIYRITKAREEMMPLQDLVEDDTVEEAA
jgi:hypothetical protein